MALGTSVAVILKPVAYAGAIETHVSEATLPTVKVI